MKVVFDASFLVALLDENAVTAYDPVSGGIIDRPKERLGHLLDQLDKARAKVLIPTPALAEVFAKSGDAGPKWLQIIDRTSVLEVVPFDTLGAIEAAAMFNEAQARGDWKDGSDSPRQKIKVDRQIAAIARRFGAQKLYTNDDDLRKILGPDSPMEVIFLSELPLPPEDPQLDLLNPHPNPPDDEIT